ALGEHDPHDVLRRRGVARLPAVADRDDLRRVLDHALGHQEAARELLVVAGRPHHDRQRRRSELDLERLFAGDVGRARDRDAVGVAQHVLQGARIGSARGGGRGVAQHAPSIASDARGYTATVTTAPVTTAARSAPSAPAPRWLYGPWRDLLFGCGLW